MKKNVIWWPAIKNPEHLDKYGNYDYYEYSKNTWKHFCKKYNCEFVEFTEPYEKDFIQYRPQWQKCLYIFEELEKRGIDYDQIALVDSTAMVRWDCPNFFELTDRKFTAWRDIDNLRWIYDSVQGYKELFNGFDLDISKYFNSGFLIFNEEHKQFFTELRAFYEENRDTLVNLQRTVQKGNDQTPINYLIQMKGVEVNMDLPKAFNLCHINRKEMFSYNWQLNTDQTSFFLKYGYIYRSTGIPKEQRSNMMQQVWNATKQFYSEEAYYNDLIDSMPNKDTEKWTTSKKFKQDLVKYFSNSKDKTCIELGSCRGNTTLVYSNLFNKVVAVEYDESNIQLSKERCKYRDNIEYIQFDVNSSWEVLPAADIVNPDALHDIVGVEFMLNNVKKYYPQATVIMDDYGHEMNTIKVVIDKLIKQDAIDVLQWIGEGKGYKAGNGKMFVDKEGLIFKFK